MKFKNINILILLILSIYLIVLSGCKPMLKQKDVVFKPGDIDYDRYIEMNDVINLSENKSFFYITMENPFDYPLKMNIYADCFEGFKLFEPRAILFSAKEKMILRVEPYQSIFNETKEVICSIHSDTEYFNQFNKVKVNIQKIEN